MRINTLIVVCLLSCMLAACGGSGTQPSNPQQPTEPEPVEEVSIFTPNMMMAMQTGLVSRVDLTENVRASATAELYISDIQPLNYQSEQCLVNDISALSFTMQPNSAVGCDFKYTVSAEQGEPSSAVLRVSTRKGAVSTVAGEAVVLSASSTETFSAVTELGLPVAVDVSTDGFNLDKDSFVVLGSGTTSWDVNYPNVITYEPGEEDYDTGVTRVLFSYTSADESATKLGSLDISVSSDLLNFAPVAADFRYGDLAFKQELIDGELEQLPHIEVPLNETVTIDIAAYFDQGMVNSNGDAIALVDGNGDAIVDEQGQTRYFYLHSDGTLSPEYQSGSTLVDADGEAVQLVRVAAYNALVQAIDTDSSGNPDFNSTRFEFFASEPAFYYVSYELSDHHGGYSSGIIEIQAGPVTRRNKPWFALNTANAILSAPLSGEEADALYVPYSSITEETGIDGPNNYGTALMTWDRAKLYCGGLGGVLPTVSQLTALAADFPSGLFTSLDKYNPDPEKQDKPVNWPTSVAYWTQTQDVDAAGSFYAVPLNESGNYDATRSYDASNSSNTFAVTCSVPGKIEAISGTSGAYRQPYDAQDFNTVTVTVTDFSGYPLPDAEVIFSSPSSIFVEPKNATTDQNGMVTVKVSSRVAGDVSVTARAFRSTMSTSINFLDVPRYVRSINDRDVCFYDTLELMAQGDCNQATIKFDDADYYEGENYDSITDDGTYMIRRYGGRIYTYLDIISATKNPTNEKQEGERGYLTRQDARDGWDDNAMFYDGNYYWRAFNNDTIKAFSTISNMAQNKNELSSYSLSGDGRYTMAYDDLLGLYLRVNEVDSQRVIRGYEQVTDMINNASNYVLSIPYQNAQQTRDKFVVIN